MAKVNSKGTTTTKAKNYVGVKTNPETDHIVREKIVGARIALLLKAPFFGNLATRLQLVNADDWCPTAATDGRKFYYNSEFLKKMPAKQLEFLMGHEVLHCVYDHMGRRGERDPQLWNIADDYCVNQDLLDQRIGEKIPVGLYEPKYRGWSAEEVYDDLYKNAEKIDIDDLVDQLLDEHLDGDGDSGDGENDGEEKKEGQGRPKLSEEERKQIRDEIKEAVMAAAAASDGAGNLPAGVRRIIQDMTAPKLNWRELLRMQLESTIKSDYTWMRASRRGWYMDAVMPGQRPDELIDVAIGIDASGSIDERMLRDFLAETQGIMDQFQSYRIHIFTFDTRVYNPAQYNSDNLDTMCDYEVSGGGGTDFDAIFNYLKEEQIEPKRLVVFTDGYPFGSWGDENYADTVWIIHGNTTVVPPWGQYAYYEKEARH